MGFVDRNLLGNDFRTGYREIFGQFGTQFFGKTAHLSKIGHAVIVQPLPKLFGTKRLFAEGGNLFGKFGLAQAEKFNLFRHGYFLPHLALMAL